MERFRVVIDTNVLVAALRSKRGASFKLMQQIGLGKFELSISVPLLLEYEEVSKRLLDEISLNALDIENILDYICHVAKHQKIFYLWRPFLRDPRDDMVLELAVTAGCNIIVTYNKKDYRDIEHFGIRILNPKEFLLELGVIS